MFGVPGILLSGAWLYFMTAPEFYAIRGGTEMTTLSTPTENGAVLEYRLTAMDRCDSCGAQAYIAAEVNGSELLFCAHHGRKYEEKLRSVATSWHDETARLDETA
jgi:hypothetical protein